MALFETWGDEGNLTARFTRHHLGFSRIRRIYVKNHALCNVTILEHHKSVDDRTLFTMPKGSCQIWILR